MTITSINRNGLLPPGCVDGFCAICKREVIADERDPRCDNCGQQLHPASLARVPDTARNGAQVDEPDDRPLVEPVSTVARRNEAVALKPEVKTVTLPASREALAWDRATDRWLATAEAAEAQAKTEYERASAHYEATKREANRLRHLRQAVRVEGAAEATSAANPVTTAPRVKRSAGGKHGGRCAAPNPCKGCQRQQEAQTHE